MRDHLLHFARMLRRTVDEHAVHLFRNGVGDLSFEIELFLAADFELPWIRCGAAAIFAVGLAAFQMQRRQHELLFRFGFSAA